MRSPSLVTSPMSQDMSGSPPWSAPAPAVPMSQDTSAGAASASGVTSPMSHDMVGSAWPESASDEMDGCEASRVECQRIRIECQFSVCKGCDASIWRVGEEGSDERWMDGWNEDTTVPGVTSPMSHDIIGSSSAASARVGAEGRTAW